MNTVAILFARADSVYKTIPGCDVYDETRDARNWPGGVPVVAHPPCRTWSRLRNFAKAPPHEAGLALWAVDQVRRYGGVLEHPQSSKLWPAAGLPEPGQVDEFGGFTVGIRQFEWGHKADKPTLLYIVGIAPSDLPMKPFSLGYATHKVVSFAGFRKGMPGWRPEVSKADRERTPPPLAEWLVALARLCSKMVAE